MLLRSLSTPNSSSWNQNSKEFSSPESDVVHQNLRRRSFSLTAFPASPFPGVEEASRRMERASSESDLRQYSSLSKMKPSFVLKSRMHTTTTAPVEEEEQSSLDRLFSSSGLDEVCQVGDEDRELKNVLAESGGGVGGRICGGGGGAVGGRFSGRGPDDSDDSDSGHGNDRTDVLYQQIIDANPQNSLLLGNYAKFLKDFRGDLARAEEYCRRAILCNPGDGSSLSLYADILWQGQRDARRAEDYFKQAVRAAPDDCYVQASYARFLWDAADGEEEEQEDSMALIP